MNCLISDRLLRRRPPEDGVLFELRTKRGVLRGLALVDDKHVEALREHAPWYVSGNYSTRYVRRGRMQEMHRFLAEREGWAIEGELDHVNGEGRDNRVSNLRVATRAQQTENTRRRSDATSGFKGIVKCPHTGRWSAAVQARGEREFIRGFDRPSDAALAHDLLALARHGRFAKTNVAMGLLAGAEFKEAIDRLARGEHVYRRKPGERARRAGSAL